MWDVPVLSHGSSLRIPRQKPTLYAGALREGGSSFFGAFPSNRIPKETNDINVHFFNHNSNSCKSYQQIPVTF